MDGVNGIDGKDGKDGSPDTGEQIIEKLNPLKNKLDFEILTNIPDFVQHKDLPLGGMGGGGGPTLLFQDEGTTITQNPITKLNVTGSGGSISYTGSGVATLNLTGGGAGTVTTNSSLTGDGSGGSPLGINLTHSNTWTVPQTFLDDTTFSEPDPVSSNTLKLIYYTKDNVLFQESWSLGYNNSLPVADLSQIVIGNNNTMSSFAGFIAGFGNTATTTEDIFLLGLNNTSDSTSAGIGIGISNTLGSGSLQFAIGHTNTLGNFNNLVAVGLGNVNSANSTVTVGINLSNSLTNSLDMGISDTTKATLTTTYGRFRTNIGIGIIPVSTLHMSTAVSTDNFAYWTNGTTGDTSTDGLRVGITATGVAEIRNYENTAINIYTLGTLLATYAASASPRYTV